MLAVESGAPEARRPSRWELIRAFYDADIVARGKEPELLLLVAFLLTFAGVRFVAYSIRYQWLPFFTNVVVGDVHVHHMVPGMVLVLVAGFLGLTMEDRRPTRQLAVLFGVGAGLVLDEFALWLQLKDVYWEPEGRQSIDAVIVASTLGVLYLLEFAFWRHLIKVLVGRFRRAPTAARPAEERPPRQTA